jgi:acetyl-CoA carboxylase biotin carboxyl carrier protein
MAKKPKTKPEAGMEVRGVDLAEVERLLDFMKKHGLEEFEYARGGVHIRLKKPSEPPAKSRASAHEAGSPAPPHTQGVTPSAVSSKHAEDAGRGAHVIKSPIVGTFYAAPSQDAEPFVTVGSRVEQGQVLCIIEAMKLMNEIESDVTGEIAEIYVENGNPVEYGEALFAIRPAETK